MLVEHEAVGQHGVVGRAAAGAAGLEQRGVEPAAVLVGAFEVHHRVGTAVADPVQACERGEGLRILQREGVGRARIEPDVEHVVDLAPVLAGTLPEEALAGALGVPGVGALGGEGCEDAGVHRLVDEHAVPGIDEDGDRHAPGALAGDHPVRAVGDHAGDAGLAGRRHPICAGDLLQGEGAQRREIAIVRAVIASGAKQPSRAEARVLRCRSSRSPRRCFAIGSQ